MLNITLTDEQLLTAADVTAVETCDAAPAIVLGEPCDV